MEDHERYELLLSRGLDEELSAEERADLRAHLDACPACRAVQRQLLELRAFLDEPVEEQPPESLLPEVMHRVWLEATLPLRRRRRSVLAGVSALAACLLLTLGIHRAGLLRMGAAGGGSSSSGSSARVEQSAPQAAGGTVSTDSGRAELDGGAPEAKLASPAQNSAAASQSAPEEGALEYAAQTERGEDALPEERPAAEAAEEERAAKAGADTAAEAEADAAEEAAEDRPEAREQAAPETAAADTRENFPPVPEMSLERLARLKAALGAAPGQVYLYRERPADYAESAWQEEEGFAWLALDTAPTQAAQSAALRSVTLGEGPVVLVVLSVSVQDRSS